MKKYLEYRLNVDQITKGSLRKEQTHMRHVLLWSQDTSFRDVMKIRPTFPEYMLSARLDDEEGQLSAVYIKKTLATARTFLTWLSDNETGYRHIKQGWIKTVKAKRLSDIPKSSEYVTLEEILAIASRPVRTIAERRNRAALVFLYLSGMRIGAFVSLPIQAIDIRNRDVLQYPSLGVRTKNSKHKKTHLLNIPELLNVVLAWDDEVRSILPPSGFWFAPLSPKTGEIDTSISQVGEHRVNLASKGFKQWLEQEGLPYHSPHKFRHGHIHYGLSNAENIADFKAVSMNAMHANMEITDQFYSVLRDEEIKDRISSLGKEEKHKDQEVEKLLREILSRMGK